MTNQKLSSLITTQGKELIKYSGNQLIDRLGNETILKVVSSILCGGNVRDLTESLTQRRLLIMNASVFVTYLRGVKNINDFEANINSLITQEIADKKVPANEKQFLKWYLGITGKSMQNVLRNDNENNIEYLNSLERNLQEIAAIVTEDYGFIETQVKIEKENYLLRWPSLLRIFLALGSQTLAIRGSEKSMYGKLFEKLILGSVLSLLGFKLIDQSDTSQTNMVFWLSQRENKRESDATVLVKNGVGARFDIGFIGTGNTEISLDKVSRFERELEFGSQTHYVSTIILVDRIGTRSRISEMAKEINGDIIQMSMTYWVKEVAKVLKEKCLLEHPIINMTNEQSLVWIRKEMQNIDLAQFLHIKVTAKKSRKIKVI